MPHDSEAIYETKFIFVENRLDQRLQQLTAWVKQHFPNEQVNIAPASGDASFRRYFRASIGAQTYIVMDAPPDKEDSRPFVRIAGWLHAMGLCAPQVLQGDEAAGFYLLTDLGTELYLAHLNETTVDDLYRHAIDALLVMQEKGKAHATQLPAYDEKLLLTEMQLFIDWYLIRHLGCKLDTRQRQVLADTFSILAQSALAQPKVFVHRDYHSRNLMHIEHNKLNAELHNPGILDFQDAVFGPVTYDLVSLLRDCYIAWPEAIVQQWLHYHHNALQRSGEFAYVSLEQYAGWFDLMGIQRHLKATGIFARLNYRDGKPGYLPEIPRTLGYVFAVAAHHPQLAPLLQLLDELAVSEKIHHPAYSGNTS